MGSDISGIINHRLAYPPPQTLADELNAAAESGNRFLQGPWSWNVDAIGRNSGYGLTRAGFTEVWFGSKSAVLSTGIGWFETASQKRSARNLLFGMFELSRFFKSSALIVLPDDQEPWFSIRQSVLDEGASFEEIMRKVKQIKKPCRVLREAIREDGSIDGYLLFEEPFVEWDTLI